MDNKTFCEPSNLAKRRKDKENANRELAEKFEKKRILHCKWNQTGTEVTVELPVGQPVSGGDVVDYDIRDSSIHLELPGAREWNINLYRPVIKEDTVLQIDDDRILIKLFKRIPNELWPHLEVSKEKYEEMDTLDVDKSVDEMPTVIQLHHVKNDFYEKSIDTLDLHIYVKSIRKETLKVFFEEKHFALNFQTCDPSFLRQQGISSGDATTFFWKLNLKACVIPDKCQYKLTNSNLSVVFRKKIPCKWGVLEAPENEKSSPAVIDTWLPLMSKNAGSQETGTQVQPPNLNEIEGQPVCRTKSPSHSLISSDNAHASSPPEPLSKVHIVEHLDNRKEVNKKPTCTVHPLNKSKNQEQVVMPGFTGLENLGNTCFMNSVIQCLANTREFRDYFLDGYFEDEINTENPLGMKGHLARIFAALLNVLWSGVHRAYAPSKLKTLIGLKASQFTGFAQHDAQELMTFLLDGLHEDLNRIKNKPYTQIIESDGKSDEELADESWRLYKLRNDSVVVDLFQGQYKSKLVCPVCKKVSITFDPLFYLSVPLPKKQIYIPVYFFSKDPYCRPIKFIIPLNQDASVEELKEKVAAKTRVLPRNMRVFEVFNNKVHKFFGKGSSLSSVSPNDVIFVFEVLDVALAGEAVHELCVTQRIIMPRPVLKCSFCGTACAAKGGKLRRCTKCYRAGYCDQTCQRNHWTSHKQHCRPTPDMVGCPFILSIPKSQATFSNLCRLMEAFSRHSVDVFQPPVDSTNTTKCSSSECEDKNKRIYEEKNILCNQEQALHVDHGQDNQRNHLGKASALGGPSSSSSSSEESGNFSVVENEVFSDESERDKCDSNSLDSSSDSGIFSSAAEGLNINSPSTSAKQPLVRAVFGQPQDAHIDTEPLFHITPVNQHGQNMLTSDGEHMEAKDKNPLDLSSCYFMAMDWKNNDKLKNYVLVETKDLEWDFGDAYKINSRPRGGEATLEQCLHLFTEPEVLSPQEAWYCPQCKEHREATKELSLWRLPPVLVIQLKRFSFKHLLLFRDKIDSMVKFPIRNLNFAPYYCGPETGTLPIYDLYAVINHQGGILGGHYTSYARCVEINNSCRSEVGWRLFDDSRVTSVSENEIVSREAYILFYRQRNSVFRVGLPATVPQVISPVTTQDVESTEDVDLDFKDSIDSVIDEPREIDSNIRNYTVDDYDKCSPLSQLRMVD